MAKSRLHSAEGQTGFNFGNDATPKPKPKPKSDDETLAAARQIAVEMCQDHGETDGPAVVQVLKDRHGIVWRDVFPQGPPVSIFNDWFRKTGNVRGRFTCWRIATPREHRQALADLAEKEKRKTEFDRKESETRKETGMAQGADADGKPEMLEQARDIARELCQLHGETHADAVGLLMNERHGVATMGPAAGSIFKVGFTFTGRRVRSDRKTNHAREIKIWRLETDADKQGKTI